MNRLMSLYDLYKTLLTDKQQEYFQMYYYDDLSLSEIANETFVSRNAVHDNIRRTENTLEVYEEKLKIFKKASQRVALYDKIEEVTNDEAVLRIIKELQALE